MWFELWQLYEDEVHLVNGLVWVLDVHHSIVVIEVFCVVTERVVDKVQRVHGLYVFIMLALVQLSRICLCGIEQHPLHESGCPYHLHLHEKLATARVAAAHVDDGVLLQWVIWYELRFEVFNPLHLPIVGKWEHGVEEAYHQLLVLTKDFLEREVCLGVKIYSHSLLVFIII